MNVYKDIQAEEVDTSEAEVEQTVHTDIEN